MGFYAETGRNVGKAEDLAQQNDGKVVTDMAARAAFERGDGVFVVVNNGPFEAAGFIFNEDEWAAFNDPNDHRPRKYVVMDRAVAERISGYN